MHRLVLCLTLLSSVWWASLSHAATYYVAQGGSNANPGTQSFPWATVQHAANTAVAGDIVTIGPGLYFERVTITNSGTVSQPIIFQGTRGAGGSWDTIIDGSTSATGGWSSAGNGIWSASLGSPQQLFADSDRKTLWRISDTNMGNGSGMTALQKPANATQGTAFGTVLYWDGIEALFGNLAGTTYVRFRNGDNPSTRGMRAAPAGGVITINTKHNIILKDLWIQGGQWGVDLKGGSQNPQIQQCYIPGGQRSVTVTNVSNAILSGSRLKAYAIGTIDFPPGDRDPSSYPRIVNRWQYDTNKFLIGDTDTNDARIMIASGASNTLVTGNEIDNGMLGVQISETTTNSIFDGNYWHGFSDTAIYVYPDSATATARFNRFEDADHHFRFNNLHRDITFYIYANRFWQPWYNSGGGGGKHVHFSPDTSQQTNATVWVYHNSFAGGGWACDVGFEGTTPTLPNVHCRNNFISVNGVSSGGTANQMDVSSNYFDSIWFNNTVPSFVLPAGHAARNSAPNLSSLGLPGMTTAYYQDGTPDYGAIQGTGPAGGTQVLNVTKGGTGSGTVTSSPGGITCGATCNATFTTDSSVTLTASPAVGSTFLGWSGDCTGTGTCPLVMSQDRSVTASFGLVIPEPPASPPGVVSLSRPDVFRLSSTVRTAAPTNTASSWALGLRGWWRVLPQLSSGSTLWDLTRTAHMSLMNASGSPWAGTSRPGGHGEIQLLGTGTHWSAGTRYVANGPFTAMLWARNFETGTHLDLVGQVNSGFTQGWGIWKSGSDGMLRCSINNDVNSASSLAAFPLNVWTHIACTWDGTLLTLYVNGVFQSQISTSSSYPANLPLTLGALPGYTTGWWYGALDDLRLFDRALSAQGIQAHMALSQQGDPGLLRRLTLPFPQVPAPAPPIPVLTNVPWESSHFFD